MKRLCETWPYFLIFLEINLGNDFHEKNGLVVALVTLTMNSCPCI